MAARRRRFAGSLGALGLGFLRGNERGGAGLLIGMLQGNISRESSSDFGKGSEAESGRDFWIEEEDDLP